MAKVSLEGCKRFNGQTFIITGGAQGIGFGIAERLFSEGDFELTSRFDTDLLPLQVPRAHAAPGKRWRRDHLPPQRPAEAEWCPH